MIPVVRSRSTLMEVTRNMLMRGKTPSISDPDALEHLLGRPRGDGRASPPRRRDRPLDDRVDPVARHAEHAREVREVLAHGEIAVDGRCLRHVAEPVAQSRRAGRETEHGHVAPGHDLNADDRADQRRLAAPARAEEAGHDPALDRDGEIAENGRTATVDAQPLHLDRRRHDGIQARDLRLGSHRGRPVLRRRRRRARRLAARGLRRRQGRRSSPTRAASGRCSRSST